MIDGHQSNDTHPFSYTAGRQGPNPKISNHDASMKAIDRDKLEISKGEELDKMWYNKIYEII